MFDFYSDNYVGLKMNIKRPIGEIIFKSVLNPSGDGKKVLWFAGHDSLDSFMMQFGYVVRRSKQVGENAYKVVYDRENSTDLDTIVLNVYPMNLGFTLIDDEDAASPPLGLSGVRVDSTAFYHGDDGKIVTQKDFLLESLDNLYEAEANHLSWDDVMGNKFEKFMVKVLKEYREKSLERIKRVTGMYG